MGGELSRSDGEIFRGRHQSALQEFARRKRNRRLRLYAYRNIRSITFPLITIRRKDAQAMTVRVKRHKGIPELHINRLLDNGQALRFPGGAGSRNSFPFLKREGYFCPASCTYRLWFHCMF
jgi:hypothetical protein